MDTDLDTGKLVAFLGGLLLMLVIETFLPGRSRPPGRLQRLIFHGGIALANTIFIRFFVYVPLLLWFVLVEQQGWGLSRWLGLTGYTELLVSLLVLDLFDYFWHRVNHRVRILWRFHKAHHTDTSMDVTTSLRFHPGELVISTLIKALWIVIWGPSVIAWFVFESLISFSSQFHHSNIDFPDRIDKYLSMVVVTPRYHASHHAVDRAFGDANFCTILSLWDRWFGSYNCPARGGATTSQEGSLGLPEVRQEAFSVKAWLSEPVNDSNLLQSR
ncbi:MAG TPA: sterol desaturase family protein [Gammaproteobacteria bacterium]|nr:sterol desaturase family protein [Gammaproteobacteria bacterium]HIK70279.1 sterol desaturase family protein [Pseudomonadales bacterium]